MDTFEAIKRRHSYRGDFTDAAVPREDLTKIVQAGIQAASGLNEQTTSFVIVDDPDLLAETVRILDRPPCPTAKAMIFCVVDPRPTYEGVSFHVEDCSAAVENMLLAVTALGYATVWIQGVLCDKARGARLGELLGVSGNLSIRVALPLGVAAEPGRQKEKLAFDRRARFNGV